MKDLKQRFTDSLDQVETTDLARQVAALLPLLGVLLPWITMDGETSALTGADLIAYTLTSPERAQLFRTSTLAGLTLFAIPTVTITVAILVFIKTLSAQHTPALNALATALPIIMLATVAPITSTTQKTVMGFIYPDWGVALMIFPQAGLLAHSIWRNYYGTNKKGG